VTTARVLVVNAGSSSVKLRVVGPDEGVVGSVDLDAPGGTADEAAVAEALSSLGPADAVGHRVVHGGSSFTGPAVLDDGVVDAIEALGALAPLHQPPAVRLVRVVGRVRPDLPAVACFDTAFHATLPAAASTYAVPADWRVRLGVRRYGFHGLSHAWAARRAAALIGRPAGELRIVTAHLGAGASLAAVAGGASVDTTMGFTPLDGLVMATRCGSLDPGLVTWLAAGAPGGGGLPVAEVERMLEHESGLAALAGTADTREVERRAAAGDASATLALAVSDHRLRAAVAAMAAAMGGLDALVFTGGVGEHSPRVRREAVGGLAFLGLALDEAANAAVDVSRSGDADITAPGATVRTLVVAAREDLEIARLTREALALG
jgi:acetate kinase